jgi:hypothetical protein
MVLSGYRFGTWVLTLRARCYGLFLSLIPGFRVGEQGHYYCHVYRDSGRRVAAGKYTIICE